MTSPIRFAVLAAVSTETQAAEEKASIPSQLETCRKVIARHGTETAGPYILDGYSRTGYDSLPEAMENIPPLQAAIEDAAANRYDILILDNFDRLGDLAYMVGTRYRKLKKQIYSARQSGRVVPPSEYDPYADDSVNIHMHVGGIIQGYRINKLRRGYNIGIPARLEAGLHGLQVPFGYERQRRDLPGIPIPEKTALLIQMKNWLLDGLSLSEITKRANASGIPTTRGKQWDITAVRRALQHPYYAGMVSHNKTAERKRLPRSQWIVKPGKHHPLWDLDTYNRILTELEQRQRGRTYKTVRTLSGLCVCSVCGGVMYRGGGARGKRTYLSCSIWGAGHPMLEYKTAVELVAREIASAIHLEAASPSLTPASFEAELETLTAARTRTQEDYEAGIYNRSEALKRITALEKQMDDIHRKIHDIEKGGIRRQTLLKLASQPVHLLEAWIKTADSAEVNRILQTIIARVIITPQKTVQKIEFL